MNQALTQADIHAAIASEHYFTGNDGFRGELWRQGDRATGPLPYPRELERVTFCVLVLKNGFVITGESYCFDSTGFDENLGRKYAFEKAEQRLCAHLAYARKEQLYQASLDKEADNALRNHLRA